MPVSDDLPTNQYHDFLGGQIKLKQPEHGPRAGTDAVLLAASIPAKPGQHILEAGFGSGVVSFCVAARVPGLKMTGVELQPSLIDLGRSNAEYNGFSDQLRLIEGDVTSSGASWHDMGLRQDSFDHSFANPPFYDALRGRHPQNTIKKTAHMAEADDLKSWVRFLIAHTKQRGTITFIHLPDALGDLLASMEKATGDICITPIFSKQGQPASRILVQGTKGRKGPIRIAPGLVMHNQDGSFSSKAKSILQDGAALF